VAGDAFTAGGQLVGNNRGTDEMGVGVCFGKGCNNGHVDDNPEIDASGREAVRLDISSLLAGFGSFTVIADSATAGEVLFANNAAGTALGANLGDATSAGGNGTTAPLRANLPRTSGRETALRSVGGIHHRRDRRSDHL
jgi:hypothetical protein